jgi:hypothetical protein
VGIRNKSLDAVRGGFFLKAREAGGEKEAQRMAEETKDCSN